MSWPNISSTTILCFCAAYTCITCVAHRDAFPRDAAILDRLCPTESPETLKQSPPVSETLRQFTEHQVRIALAISLLGMVTISCVLLYLSNCSNQHIKHSTMQVISGTLSIFCALLIYGSIKKGAKLVKNQFTVEKESDHTSGGSAVKGVFLLAGFIFAVFVIHVLLWQYKKDPNMLAALGGVGAHVIGFVGTQTFGHFVTGAPSSNEAYYLISDVAFAILVFMGIGFSSSMLRSRSIRSIDAAGGHEGERWDHNCEHTENEFIGFTTGFLISMVVRFGITGTIPTIHGDPKNKSKAEVIKLIEAAICACVVHICYAKLAGACRLTGSHLIKRVLVVLTEICSMTTGWLLLYAANWIFWNLDQFSDTKSSSIEDVRSACQMTASLLVALAFSVLAFGAILPLSLYAEKVGTRLLGSLISAIVLGVGFTWENAFYYAIKSISKELQTHEASEMFAITINLSLCIIVLPAWKRNILPHALDAKEVIRGLQHKSMMIALHKSLDSKGFERLSQEEKAALTIFRSQQEQVHKEIGDDDSSEDDTQTKDETVANQNADKIKGESTARSSS